MIEAPAPVPTAGARLPRGQRLRRGLAANPLMLVGGLMCALIVAVAVFAPLLAPFPADAGSATHPFTVLRPPSAQHWFGTDNVGRDVYSRVLYGARISPLIAVLVLLLACAIGIPLGVAAGYFGGWLDEAIMRVTDIFLAFPSLLLALIWPRFNTTGALVGVGTGLVCWRHRYSRTVKPLARIFAATVRPT
jgi:peptide/nickel transport system permease protein